jgi:hypothetical protein
VSTEPEVTPPPAAPAARFESDGPEHCIARRRGGVYADASRLGTTLLAAFDSMLQANTYFTDLDYPLLMKALYGHGPDLPRSASGEVTVRFASDFVPFDPARRALYRSLQIEGGNADYYFEPVFLADPDDPEAAPRRVPLDLDEFIADMWLKGIRFGIDIDAVRAAIDSGQAGRVTVARRLEPVPGQDAAIIEVSEDIHRNDAPRLLANGRLDLMSFQNRFPQVQRGVKLLKKLPRTVGQPGFELSGIKIEPALPGDVDLAAFCGLGTVVERTGDGEFLVSQQAGFLAVDAGTRQISVGDKIVSHDGVSSRTTGNLQLTGDFEEFGEVQEKRVIAGEGIVVHADVFGKIVSRGGLVLLNRNLVGGSAHNRQGDIRVKGVASGAVIQASCGEVVLTRAENCIVSGTRVTIEHAVNCDIIGEEVQVGVAEGCAIAGLHVTVETAAPRRQSEMVVYALRPDCAALDKVLEQVRQRGAELGQLAAKRQAEIERMMAQSDVRKYVSLAARVRKGELVLSPEQAPHFQKMAAALGPSLKAIGQLQQEVKSALSEQRAGLAMVAQLEQQRSAGEGSATIDLRALQGDTQVRTLAFRPDAGNAYDLAPRDIKTLLRGPATAGVIFAGYRGSFRWNSSEDGAR